SEYNKVRQRLLNSEDLLEGTELVLFHLNETTLTRWYNEKTRRDEVTMLLQGRQLPPSRVPAEQPLPPAKEGPSRLVSPPIPFELPEPEDRTGLANVRRSNVPSTSDLAQLRRAKEAELGASGVWSLEKENLALHINKKELHCRRRTRGTEDTTRLIKEQSTWIVNSGTFISYDDRMMNQLTDAMRVSFPGLLTRKYARDRSILSLLRAHTLGNSSTAMQHNILERHSEKWLWKQLQYLSACKHHQNAMRALNMPTQQAMIGTTLGPATSVDASPLVEALCIKLESVQSSPQKQLFSTSLTMTFEEFKASEYQLPAMQEEQRKEAMIGTLGPATSVDASPLVEALCIKLESVQSSSQKRQVPLLNTLTTPYCCSVISTINFLIAVLGGVQERRKWKERFSPKPCPHQLPWKQKSLSLLQDCFFQKGFFTQPRHSISLKQYKTFRLRANKGSLQTIKMWLEHHPQLLPVYTTAPSQYLCQKQRCTTRKKREGERQGNENPKRKYIRKSTFNLCHSCQMSKTKDFGHSHHIGRLGVDTFCPAVEGKQYVSKEA
ncbi:uncharacterized protein, partial [Apostichopus japonicus]|uniref:uncharacterized protein n=1 Tax=Stichopus japonicus TaxID=307972 RepID=UPI003AB6605C